VDCELWQCCKLGAGDLIRFCEHEPGDLSQIRRDTRNALNEADLSNDIALRYPPHLSLANHIHCFDFLSRPPRRVERPEALTRADPPLYGSMVLLHYIVQIPYGSATTASTQFAGRFQLRHPFRVDGFRSR
jgi:hypothetical protein